MQRHDVNLTTALLDQRRIATSQEAYAEFLAKLDAARPNERLRKMLQTPAPWQPVGLWLSTVHAVATWGTGQLPSDGGAGRRFPGWF